MAEHVTVGLIWLRIAAVDVPSSVKSGVHSFERQYVPFWLCLIAFGSLETQIWRQCVTLIAFNAVRTAYVFAFEN